MNLPPNRKSNLYRYSQLHNLLSKPLCNVQNKNKNVSNLMNNKSNPDKKGVIIINQ